MLSYNFTFFDFCCFTAVMLPLLSLQTILNYEVSFYNNICCFIESLGHILSKDALNALAELHLQLN